MSDINVFIVVNLGCEMLYVIDQRLRAQGITLDKSVQGKYTNFPEENPS